MKNLTLSNFWRRVSAKVHGQDIGLGLRPQCSDVSLDRRLTVGSPSVQYASTTSARTAREWLKPVAVSLLLFTFAVGQMWGDYTLVYTLDGTTTGGDNGYATESSITQNSKSWKVTGNTTTNPWRIGGKSISKVDRPIYSTSNFTDNINKVEVALGTIDGLDNIHSITLIVSTSSNGGGTVTNTEKKTSGLSANSTVTFTRPSGQNWSSKYFKVVFNVTESSSSNKYVQLKSIKLYKTTYTVSYNSNGGSGTMTDSSSPYNEGATVTVKSNTFTAPTGKAFNGWNTASGGGGTSYAANATFTISANTTLYAQWATAATTVSLTKAGQTNGSFLGTPLFRHTTACQTSCYNDEFCMFLLIYSHYVNVRFNLCYSTD